MEGPIEISSEPESRFPDGANSDNFGFLLNWIFSEFLSLKGGCTASSDSTLVKMPRCWKSHVAAQNFITGAVCGVLDHTMQILRMVLE